MTTTARTILPLAIAALLSAACGDSRQPSSGDDDGSGTSSDTTTGAGGAPTSSITASGSTTTGTTATGVGGSCTGIFAGGCGSCLEGACCGELAGCNAVPGCLDCVTGEGLSGCESKSAASALLDCASTSCESECFAGTGGGGSSSASAGSSSGGSGGGGSYDLVNCTGPASTSGTVLGVTPSVLLGYVWPDPSGNVAVALYPKLATDVGDVTVGVYFFATAGQLDYAPNGTVGCAILEDAGSEWSVVDTTQLCEVHLSTLQFASAEGVCDGQIEGIFQGIFSGNAPLAGVFSLPLEVAESQTSGPSCQPPNGPCSQNSDCCTASCSMFIGVCN